MEDFRSKTSCRGNIETMALFIDLASSSFKWDASY